MANTHASACIGHVGVLTSGGDAPGMNAAVRAVVRASHYHGLQISGILEGFEGLVQDAIKPFGVRDVSNIIQRGGTILRTARSAAFHTPEGRARAKANLDRRGIDALVVIGGDGTFRGAAAFNREHALPVIGIPGTIDNDVAGTDASIGFDTATNTAMELIDRIRDTASAHDRLFFVEVMGRTSGAIATHCGVAAGAEYVLVPEQRQDIPQLIQVLERSAQSKSSVIVIVAEGDEEGGAYAVARKVKDRFAHYDTRVSVLGHVQRGGNPTVRDRILASRSGVAAVEGLLQGRTNEMVGVVNGRITYTEFTKAIQLERPEEEDLLRIQGILSI